MSGTAPRRDPMTRMTRRTAGKTMLGAIAAATLGARAAFAQETPIPTSYMEDREPSPVAPDHVPAPASTPEPEPEYTLGEVIAWTAQQYIGYPYAAAANGPYAFDCSGFTQYIVLITAGIDLGHAVENQPWHGTWVDYNAWLPGDIIFFQNTYRPGISHAAIYIGDGLICHAENWDTGVTIDSLWSSYYAPRYWGAIRVG